MLFVACQRNIKYSPAFMTRPTHQQSKDLGLHLSSNINLHCGHSLNLSKGLINTVYIAKQKLYIILKLQLFYLTVMKYINLNHYFKEVEVCETPVYDTCTLISYL